MNEPDFRYELKTMKVCVVDMFTGNQLLGCFDCGGHPLTISIDPFSVDAIPLHCPKCHRGTTVSRGTLAIIASSERPFYELPLPPRD